MKSRKSGFTLIEIVVTLAVASILAAMIFQIFSSVYSVYRKINDMAEYQSYAQVIMIRIKNELKYADSVTIENDIPASIVPGNRYIYVTDGTPQLNVGNSSSDAVSIAKLSSGFSAELIFTKSSDKSIRVSVSIKNKGTIVYNLDADVYLNNIVNDSISGSSQGLVIRYTLP